MRSKYFDPQLKIFGFLEESVLTVSETKPKSNAQIKAEQAFADEGIEKIVGMDW